jgi:phosphoglycerol transferase MdoB-like AlkP superfamily enzyme
MSALRNANFTFRKMILKRLIASRYGIVLLLAIVTCALFFLLRLALLVNNINVLDLTIFDIPKIFFVGVFYDLAFLSYLFVPFVIYLACFKSNPNPGWIRRSVTYILSIAVIATICFDLVSEWLFWNEFQVRYNFISVDYLVYRREVAGNINESYPVFWLLLAVTIVTLIVFAVIKRWIDRGLKAEVTFKNRMLGGLALLVVPVICYFSVTSDTFSQVSTNNYKNELAKNGPYQFFFAFFHNELNYERFYLTGDPKVLDPRLRALVKQDNQTFLSNKEFDISRQVTNPGPEKKLNVVMIVVESLSGDYMTRFGNKLNLTPHLDELANQSLFFNNFYASGNRTVRGMEALTLSIPPTPGQSVLHRPNNEGLFSLGSLLRDKGYDTKFIYGGYGYFDNMNYYFSHNGFNIVDRTSFASDESTFGNVWGVSDEY